MPSIAVTTNSKKNRKTSPQKIIESKLFIDKYEWKGINYQP